MPEVPVLHPRQTALLVMDYQPGIVDQIADSGPLLHRVLATIASVRGRGGHVGWVRVAFTDAEFDAVPATSTFAAMANGERRAGLHADAPTTQIDPRLTVEPGDALVRKIRVGAFTTTDLDEQLRGRGVDTVVLAGLSTSGVVLSTVREAMDRDYRVVVLEDACADPEPDKHGFLTGRIFPSHGHVTTIAGLETLWG